MDGFDSFGILRDWGPGGDLRRAEKEDNALLASHSASVPAVGSVVAVVVVVVSRRAFSHTTIKARPWAILARRATVQVVLASRSLSNVTSLLGLLYAAIR